MTEGEARFPGGTPLSRALTMQRSIVLSGSEFLRIRLHTSDGPRKEYGRART